MPAGLSGTFSVEQLIPAMNYSLVTVLSLSAALPAVLGLVRFQNIEPLFHPFVILTWAGLVSEVISLLLVHRGGENLVVYNLYLLAEYWLLLWQFRRWRLFGPKAGAYSLLLAVGTGWWLFESFVLDDLRQVNSYFVLGSSLAVVVMSIVTASRMLYFESYRLLCNAKFVICLGLLLYAGYSILVEAFLLFGLGQSRPFQVNVYRLLNFVNAFVNLVFAYSVLCMPTRLAFIGRL